MESQTKKARRKAKKKADTAAPEKGRDEDKGDGRAVSSESGPQYLQWCDAF